MVLLAGVETGQGLDIFAARCWDSFWVLIPDWGIECGKPQIVCEHAATLCIACMHVAFIGQIAHADVHAMMCCPSTRAPLPHHLQAVLSPPMEASVSCSVACSLPSEPSRSEGHA